jgi:hypothetical protein
VDAGKPAKTLDDGKPAKARHGFLRRGTWTKEG